MNYESAQQERDAVAAYAKAPQNKFPSRMEILTKTQERKDEFGLYMFMIVLGQQKPGTKTHDEEGDLIIDSFDESNYNDLKAIYDSGMDRTVAQERGKRIAARGELREPGYGIEELRGLYRVMEHYSPFAKSRDLIIRSLGTTCLNSLWDGISIGGNTWSS
jgi:hypothetical protein